MRAEFGSEAGVDYIAMHLPGRVVVWEADKEAVVRGGLFCSRLQPDGGAIPRR